MSASAGLLAEKAPLIVEFEREVRDEFRPLMLRALQQRVGAVAESHEGSAAPRCPECGRAMKSRGRGSDSSKLTCFGTLVVNARHFRCRRCKRNACPMHDALGLEAGRLSGALARLVAVLACVVPYEMAVMLAELFFGVKLSAMTVWRVAQRLGAAAESHVEGSLLGAADVVAGAATGPLDAPSAVVLGVDGCALGMQVRTTRRRRRPGDGPLEPLPALEEGHWREVKTGVLLLPDERRESSSGRRSVLRRFVVTCLGNADTIFARLQGKLTALGWLGPHTVVVIVGDGAEWIWNRAKMFPNCCEILDFWHAMEYAWVFAKAFWGTESPFTVQWVASIARQLKAGEVEQVIAYLQGISVPEGGEAHKAWAALIKYYSDHISRMRYDEYLRLGYGIGSGAVESAHKQVVHARLRQAGMRWSVLGAQRLLALRQLLLNGEWSGTVDRLQMRGDAELLAA